MSLEAEKSRPHGVEDHESGKGNYDISIISAEVGNVNG